MAERLTEEIDYYWDEKGLMVLTENYLRRRGTCCQNGCRHCPYGFRKKEDDDLNSEIKSPTGNPPRS